MRIKLIVWYDNTVSSCCDKKPGKNLDTNLDIPKAYHGTLAATPMLKEEFLQLCWSNAIPPQFHSFYKSLLTGTVMGNDHDNNDPDHDYGGSDSNAESD